MTLLLMLMMMMMKVNSFKLRHFEQRQFGICDECHVTGVDKVAQSLGWPHTLLHIINVITLGKQDGIQSPLVFKYFRQSSSSSTDVTVTRTSWNRDVFEPNYLGLIVHMRRRKEKKKVTNSKAAYILTANVHSVKGQVSSKMTYVFY